MEAWKRGLHVKSLFDGSWLTEAGADTPRGEELRLRQVSVIAERSAMGAFVSTVNAVLTAVVMSQVVPLYLVGAWVSIIAVLSAYRLYSDSRARARGPLKRVSPRSPARIVALSTLRALVWGAGAVLMFPDGQIPHQLFLVLVVGGMAAGSASLLAPIPLAAIATVVAMVAPLGLRFVFEGDAFHLAVTGMFVTYILGLMVIIRGGYRIFADSVAIRLENADLVKRIGARNTVMEKLTTGASLEETLSTLTKSTVEIRPGSLSSISLVDKKENTLRYYASTGLPDYCVEALDVTEISATSGSCGAAAWSGERVIAEDLRTHPNWEPFREIADLAGIRSCWSEPIKSSNGKVLGSCAIYTHSPSAPSESDIELLKMEARLAALAVERKQAEDALKQQADIIDQLQESVIASDLDGNVILWNKGAERLYGYTEEEVLGRNISFTYVPEDHERLTNDFINVIKQKGSAEFDVRRVKRSGEVFFVHASASIYRDVDGEVVGLLGCSTDITQRKALEDRLNRAERLEAVGQLTGGIAHDFNNLLAIVIGNLELLTERADDELTEKFGGTALKAAKRGASLTHRLLAFSRRQILLPQVTDVNDLVTDMLDILTKGTGDDVTLETQLGADLWHTCIDPAQLENALINLARNASDAMPEGGSFRIKTSNVKAEDGDFISLDEEPLGDVVVLEIRDSGCGIPKEDLERVFEPFVTTKDVGSGSGLGLSMVYGFVNQSGGHIHIDSETGHYTAVTIALPRTQDEKLAAPEQVADLAEADGKGQTILIVEDEADVRELTADILERLGYRTILASSAEDALALLESADPVDLLFTDIDLPGGPNGRELAESARVNNPDLKVLYTSGYSLEDLPDQPAGEQESRLLLKPYAKAELARVVRDSLVKEPV